MNGLPEILILMVIIVSITIFLFLGENIRISAISIELLVGIIFGNYLFGVVPGFPSITDPQLNWLNFLAEFGFILLMFLAGLELNIHFLKKYFKKSIVLVICIFFLSFLAGFSIGIVLQLELVATFLIGVVFAGASIGVVFPLLRELGLSSKRLGQILITTTMVLDILCILIISFIEFASVGIFNVFQFIIIISIIILFFLIILYGISPFWQYMERRTTEVKALEWEIRITFAVIVGLAVLTSVLLEIEAIIGAFLAGMIMGQSKSAHQLEEKIGSIGYGFFIPIFFFVIGMKMYVGYFTNPIFIITLISITLVLFAVKIGSSLLSSKLNGYPWKTGIITGIILVPSLTVGIAAAELGYRPEVALISDYIFTLLISLIIISSIIIPILTRLSAKRLIPELISERGSWHIHLEYDLGIYLDEYYHNIFDELTIKEIPFKQVAKLHPDTPAITILGFMQKFHQLDFPVISEDNKLLGIVDFEKVKSLIINNKFDETAKNIMHEELIYVTPEDSLGKVLDKMKIYNLELLPLIESNTLNFLGTISRDDILRFIRIRALGASISPEDQEKLSKKRVWKHKTRKQT